MENIDINMNLDLLTNENKSYELLYESVEQFMIKNGAIIEELESILLKMSRHKNGCNIAKTVGTSVSGMGSIAMVSGLVLTPFTGGLSTIVTIGGGLATAIGTVTNIGTDFTHNIIGKKFLNQIKLLAEERNKCAFDLTQKFNQFNAIISLNIKNKLNRHLSDNQCEQVLDYINLLKLMGNGSVGIYKLSNNSLKFFEAIKEFKALKAVKAVKTSSSLGTSVGKNLITLIPSETKGVNSLIRSTGPAVGKNVFKGVSAVAGLAFTVLDVVTLVQDWNKCHPTVDVINNLIEELKSDAKLVESVYNVLTIDYCDQQLINQILTAFQTNSNNNYDNYLDNESEVSLDLNDIKVSFKRTAHVKCQES